MTLLTALEWDAFLTGHPQAHLLQTSAWGSLKAAFGWRVARVRAGEGGAQLLFRPITRRLPGGPSIAYLAKGPIGADWAALWPEIHAVCRRERALLLKVEPDAWEDSAGALAARLPGFTAEARAVQPARTLLISLEGDEDAWLARMKQKTRYNIRLAEKKGVSVRPTADLDVFYRLMQATGARDGFGVHSADYFRRAYDLFHPAGLAELLLAEYDGQPLAALMVFARGARAWYFYGASNDEERNRMPTYLLQWQAMRWAKARGCASYDLWGVPDAPEETLEASFSNRSDGLWGVYRFKRGFGGQLLRSAGAWDYAYLPLARRLARAWEARQGAEA